MIGWLSFFTAPCCYSRESYSKNGFNDDEM